MLAEAPYRGEEEEALQAGRRYTFAELASRVQASEAELRCGLVEARAFELGANRSSDELGANALTLAASLNVPKPEIIKALLKAGADVNAKLGEEWSEKDTSALYRAVEGESLECVALIVAAGADLDYMNDRKVFTGLAKMTALQRAEDIGAKQIRDFLKSKGAAAVSLRFGSRRRR